MPQLLFKLFCLVYLTNLCRLRQKKTVLEKMNDKYIFIIILVILLS